MLQLSSLDLYKKIKQVTLTCLLLTTFASYAQERVTVFAAASLTNALNKVAQQYKQTPEAQNTNVVFSFAGSSTLARQVAQGAPAQLYLSANQEWLDYLISQNAVNESSKITLLENTLVLVAPKNSSIAQISLNSDWNIKQTIQDSRLAVGDPAHVPAGRYAKQALTKLQLWPQAQPLLARASNVRAALVLVERGEAELGIVYATDALISDKVKIVAKFPQSSHLPIQYPMVLVDKKPSTASQAFYAYLQTPTARSVFQRFGFQVN